MEILRKTLFRHPLGAWLLLLLLVLFSFSFYWPAITSGLVSDDWGLSVPGSNPWLSFLGSWFGGGRGYFYRPISRVAIYYEARLFGYGGMGQHLFSQVLFIATLGVTALLSLRIGGSVAALMGALYLITSPVSAGTVSWVSSQTDLLATFFVMLSVLFITRRPSVLTWRQVAASGIAGFLAYLSKDSGVVLGLLGVVYLVILAIPYGEGALRFKPALAWGAGNIIFMILYLGFRKWRLGQVGTNPPDYQFIPEHGCLWHYSQVYITGLREFFLPVTQLFPATNHLDIYAFASLWPFFLTLLLICAALVVRRYYVAAFAAAFLATLVPLITSPLPIYPETGMGDLTRYLYMPQFFLVAACAATVGKGPRQSQSFGMLLFIGAIFLQAAVAQTRIVDYARAGKFREQLIETLNSITEQGKKPAHIIFEALPDKFGSAYVFRNGSVEMVSVLFPGSRATLLTEGSLSPDPNLPVYLISVDEKQQIHTKPLEAFTRLKNEALSQPEPKPVLLDTEQGIRQLAGFATNDLTVQQEEPLVVNITGPDPVILLPLASVEQPYYRYRQAVLSLKFLDPPTQGSTGTVQFLWALEADKDPRYFPFQTQNVEISSQTQSVTFDLTKQPNWYREGKLKMARFDLPENYRGRVEISVIGLK